MPPDQRDSTYVLSMQMKDNGRFKRLGQPWNVITDKLFTGFRKIK